MNLFNKSFKMDFNLCLRCKGRHWCNRKICVFESKLYKIRQIKNQLNNFNNKLKQEFDTQTDIFIGRFNYPNVNFGLINPVINIDKIKIIDEFVNPKLWIKKNYTQYDILNKRLDLSNNSNKIHIKKDILSKKIIDIQEIALSKDNPLIEISLKQKPKINISLNDTMAPFGVKAELNKFRIIENPKTDKLIEKIYYDTDLKTIDAMDLLYKKRDVYKITKIFSTGILGEKSQRKLVPTRWSITAVDDIIGKLIINKIRYFDVIDSIKIFIGSYMYNYYIILLLPFPYSYELFEFYQKNALWNPTDSLGFSHDYEGFKGRTQYAENTIGGYYAARIAILKYLENTQKQASILVLRFISNKYSFPLGVWIVREAVNKTMNNKNLISNLKPSKNNILKLIYYIIYQQKNIDLKQINQEFDIKKIINILNKNSVLINSRQKNLNDYFS